MSEKTFKKYVKIAMTKAALEYLVIDKQTKSKLSNLESIESLQRPNQQIWGQI